MLFKFKNYTTSRVVLCALVLIQIAVLLIYTKFPNIYDDAYMFIRYGFNVIHHGVYGWNIGQPAYGCTSVGYVVSTVLFLKAGGLNLLTQNQFLFIQSFTYFLLFLFTVYKLSRLALTQQAKYSTEISLVIINLSILGLIRQLNGMDTMMSVFSNGLLVYTAFVYLRKQNTINLLYFAFASYFTFLVRPDNLLYGCLFSSIFLLVNRVELKRIVWFCLVLLALLSVDSLVKYYYFGDVLPIPFYVKSESFYDAYLGIDKWNSYHYFANFILIFSPFIFTIFYGLGRKQILQIVPFFVPFILTNFYLLNKVQIMGFDSRLMIPSLPFLIGAALLIINNLDIEALSINRKNLVRGSLSLGAIIAIFFTFQVTGSRLYAQKKALALAESKDYKYQSDFKHNVNEVGRASQFELMNELIHTIAQNDFVIAASEHGLISSFNPETKILCLAGLHNVEILKEKSFNENVIDRSIEGFNPDLIWMAHPDYVALNHKILASSPFQKNFEFYDGFLDFGIAINKNSKYKAEMERYFMSIYNIEKLRPTIYNLK
jgi:hypothetical protein